jgi:serine/threonine protein kinase
MDYAVKAQTNQLLAGRYRMERLLGSGGFGAVYFAADERLHRPVAIKVCSTHRLPTYEAQAAAQLFQDEALTLARLRHPGLTAIWDYFNYEDDWYLVMEYVPGESLRALLRRVAGPLPQAEAFDYARQLCLVLRYLHCQQPPVVFRDLKPANIMVTPEGLLKLIDFGIARLFSPDKAADTVQFGTPGYAPPEQYGGQTEPRSDLYSLGVVLHEMLTGHNPATSPFALPPVRAINPALPEALETLIMRATALEIDERMATADEFCHELDAALRPTPAHSTSVLRIASASPVQRHTTSNGRQLWTPAPRTLPSRPESNGIGRTIMLLVMLTILLGSLGTGGYMLRTQIAPVIGALRQQTTTPLMPDDGVPDQIIFSAQTSDGSENLYELRDERTRPLTQFEANVHASQPVISPDGARIAFTKSTDTTSEVWVMDVDGSNQQPVLPGYFARSPAWSLDGQQLAVEVAEAGEVMRQHDIVLVDLQTGATRPLVATAAWEGGPAWSPDGAHIVYHASSSDTDCMQLFAISIQDGAVEQLTNLRGIQCQPQQDGDFWPAWSPDGTRIAFGRKLDGKEQLMLLNSDTKQVQIVDTGDAPAGHPRWSADGRHLLFKEGKGTATSLARLNFDTLRITPINTDQTGSHLADWR